MFRQTETEDTLMKTTMVKDTDVTRAWHLLDAAGQPAGRLAATVAGLLRGRIKPDYTPHADMGDFVVVINAAKVKLTGRKEEQKFYKHYTGFPSGLKEQKAAVTRVRRPAHIVRHAVIGMLPANHLASRQLKRLKIYADDKHPHQAQPLKPYEL